MPNSSCLLPVPVSGTRLLSQLLITNMIRSAAILALFSAQLIAAPHWDIQYRYRQLDSTLTINDIVFPSAKRGVVAGFITDRKQKDKPIVMVTIDGGANWTEYPVKETALSLFFLDDSAGWMVTERGIWATEEIRTHVDEAENGTRRHVASLVSGP